MFVRIICLLLAAATYAAPAQAGIWNLFSREVCSAPPAIKVLVLHDKPGAVIEVKGKYRVYDPKTNEYLGIRYVGKRKFMQALRDGLMWGEEFPGVHQLLIVPDSQDITVVVDGIEYRGTVYVYDIQGTISVVNEVDIEDYLKSMMSPQMRNPHPEESLAATAIAARTQAYYQAMNPKSTFWAVDASKIGYLGFAVTNSSSELESAIDATRYLIMTNGLTQDGRAIPFPAFWSEKGHPAEGEAVVARVPLQEADSLAEKGENAAQILTKAFPNTNIVLMYQTKL